MNTLLIKRDLAIVLLDGMQKRLTTALHFSMTQCTTEMNTPTIKILPIHTEVPFMIQSK